MSGPRSTASRAPADSPLHRRRRALSSTSRPADASSRLLKEQAPSLTTSRASPLRIGASAAPSTPSSRIIASTDPALARIAAIVRGADTDRMDLAPQAAGLFAISLGLSVNIPDDHAMLRHGLVIYDALYAWMVAAQSETHNWPPGDAGGVMIASRCRAHALSGQSPLLPRWSTGDSAAPAHADEYRRLSGAEIKRLVAGKAVTDEVHYTDRFRAGGVYDGVFMNKRSTGTWTVKGAQLCITRSLGSRKDCDELWRSGAKLQRRKSGLPSVRDDYHRHTGTRRRNTAERTKQPTREISHASYRSSPPPGFGRIADSIPRAIRVWIRQRSSKPPD